MTTDNRDQTSAQSAFIAFQALSKQWYDKEREGIALIEQFQSALLSCQESMSIDNEVTPRGTTLSMVSFCERKDHNATNAWRLEDIYSQVKAMKSPFVELLEEMYALYYTVRSMRRVYCCDRHLTKLCFHQRIYVKRQQNPSLLSSTLNGCSLNYPRLKPSINTLYVMSSPIDTFASHSHFK